MPKITINGKEVEFQKGMTVLQACEIADVEVPRFCYHEKLSIAGNCRMCLVEMERCAMPAAEGMNIKTNTEFVKKARKGIMEFLLANHPLDCPVCDQGGECDLQDQSLFYGLDKSRFSENKREVKDKYMGPLIKTQMTRCIHCTRCIRFAEEVAGVPEIGAIGRGENMEITTYLEQSMTSELSANVIDLCPVGALTSKPYAFEARPWELKKTESVDVMDAVGSNIRVDTYGWEVKRILPRLNNEINEEWISDKTRYACDGLLKQRLDIPYIRKNGRLIKSNWDDALELITEKIKSLNPEEIGAHIGDMTSIETIFAFKTLLKKINCNNYDFREKNFYINPSNKENYIFNTSIQSIEESDLILLIGCNPRHEATIINARIRKAFVKNKTPIFSIGNPGDLTYEYILLGDDTIDLKNIFDGKSKINENLKNSKKPLFIIGESTLELKNAQCIFEKTKNFLIKNNFTNDTWNAFNILTQNASTVGAIDLGFYNVKEKNNFIFFDKLKNKDFKLLYLVGSDNLEIEKSGEFIIYQGSHGDRNAEIADVILPSPSYTEQDGLFENLEGRIQECRKASYPTNDALEDWKIFNLINNSLNKVNLFDNFLSIRELAIKEIPNFSEIGLLPKKNKISSKESLAIISNEKIKIKPIDYYFSNSIARASKTMSDCRNVIYNNKKNGTNN
jgi:NADH-quinone oxidoreductase subunit G